MLQHITEEIGLVTINYPGGMGETNCYLIKGDKGYTIIDTGMYSKEGIKQWQEIMNAGYKIEKIVLTHVHQDHIGLAKWFQEEIGVPVVVSKLGYGEMKKYLHPNFQDRMKELAIRHGVPAVPNKIPDTSFQYDFKPDDFFEEGDKIRLGKDLYEVIWTPGHAYDHYCFYHHEKKIMIIGDHILKHISPVIGLWVGEEMDLLKYYFESLDKIDKYRTNIALPGHGEIIYQLHERIEEIRNSHEKRLRQVYRLVCENDAKTALDICLRVYDKLNLEQMLSPFMASLTRLIFLEHMGKVERIEENGVCKFRSLES